LLSTIDLFAGCGGLSLGFEQAGIPTSHFVEIDKWSCGTLKKNFKQGEVFESDIREVDKSTLLSKFPINDEVLVIGGPPCQGFSHSNIRNKDLKDPRNSLFLEYLRLVDEIQPSACLIENVPGLLKTKTKTGKPVIDIIVSELNQIGYDAHHTILDAADYGVPQSRKRVFIVGLRKIENLSFSWPTPQNSEHISCWDAISDLPQIVHGDDISNMDVELKPRNAFQNLMKNTEHPFITHHEPMRHTQRIVDRFASIKHGESEANASVSHLPRVRGDTQKTSKRTYAQNSRRQHPDKPCNTIVSSSHSNFIHPYLNRNFTVRELMRLQSFPDNFQLCGKRAVLSRSLSIKKGLLDDLYNDQRVQVGNAVPPLLAKELALSLKKAVLNRVLNNREVEMQIACA